MAASRSCCAIPIFSLPSSRSSYMWARRLAPGATLSSTCRTERIQPEKIAGYFLTGTLVAFGLGRFSSAALMRYVKPASLMGIYSLMNIVSGRGGVAFPGWVGLWAIFITSFFMSVMFPTIFALGIEGLDQNTKIGGSLIVMAIVGGAVLTPLMGWIAQTQHSIAQAYMVPFVCYS